MNIFENYFSSPEFTDLISHSFAEDVGSGDHTSLACIPAGHKSSAKLLVKDDGIICGVELAKKIFFHADKNLRVEVKINDGEKVSKGDIVFFVEGETRSILTSERLVLNFMQHLSGIATYTFFLAEKIKNTKAKILDTRKTLPGLRMLEKYAVTIGGGKNHRIGLYDMILIKDNHVDAAGGIKNAIQNANDYIAKNKLDLKIEIETRTLDEVQQVIDCGNVHRIMFDNFSLENLYSGVKLVNGKYETEASGGVTENTIESIAENGVDFISVGAITHSVKAFDLSLKITEQ